MTEQTFQSTFESTNPARPAEVIGTYPCHDRRRRRPRRRRGHRGPAGLGPGAGAGPGRDHRRRRRRPRGPQGRAGRAREPRVRQGPASRPAATCRRPSTWPASSPGRAAAPWGDTVPSELGSKLAWTTRIPVGVVGMITPWNFPVAIPSWKCFPALLAGNGIVLKPSEHAPACAEAFVDACVEGGVPAGLIQLVHGIAEPGRRARRAPRRRRRELHRLGADRPQGRRRGHGDRPPARQPRARRQERHGRARRRRPRPRRRRRHLRRVRHRRPALHLHLAADRPPGDRRRARRAASSPAPRRSASATRSIPATDVGPVINGAAGDAHRRHGRRRGRRGRRRSPPAATAATTSTAARAASFVEPTVLTGREADAPHRPRGGVRPGALGDRGRRSRRGHRRREPRRVRAVGRRLQPRHRDLPARRRAHRHRHRLRERADDRRRDPAAVRRHEAHRQRLPRGRRPRHRAVQPGQDRLRRLLGPAPAGPDRQPAEAGADDDRRSSTTDHDAGLAGSLRRRRRRRAADVLRRRRRDRPKGRGSPTSKAAASSTSASGIAVTNVGHRHPHVTAAIHAQVDELLHTSVVLRHRRYIELAEAVGPARAVDGRAADVPVQQRRRGRRRRHQAGPPGHRPAGHHRLPARLPRPHAWARRRSPPPRPSYREGYEPLLPAVHIAPRALRRRPRRASTRILEHQAGAVHRSPRWSSSRCSARAATSCPPVDWLAGLRERCDRHGILLVFDEVQTGFGRTGRPFAAETFGVFPDVLLFAKGVASGLPLGGIVAPAAIMDRWPRRRPRLDLRRQPGRAAPPRSPPSTCSSRGLLRPGPRSSVRSPSARLRAPTAGNRAVVDVRGVGLMIGVELVDEATAERGAAALPRRRRDRAQLRPPR